MSCSTLADRRRSHDLLHGFSLELTTRDLPDLVSSASAVAPGTRIAVDAGRDGPRQLVLAARAVVQAGFTPVTALPSGMLSGRALLDLLGALMRIGAASRVLVANGTGTPSKGAVRGGPEAILSEVLGASGVHEVVLIVDTRAESEADWAGLTRSAEAALAQGIDLSLVTRFSFDGEEIAAWVRGARERGFAGAIRIGIPGPVSAKRLLAYARRAGAATNAGLVGRYGFSLSNLLGTSAPERFIDDLAQRLGDLGGLGIQLVALGGVGGTVDWARGFAEARQS